MVSTELNPYDRGKGNGLVSSVFVFRRIARFDEQTYPSGLLWTNEWPYMRRCRFQSLPTVRDGLQAAVLAKLRFSSVKRGNRFQYS